MGLQEWALNFNPGSTYKLDILHENKFYFSTRSQSLKIR